MLIINTQIAERTQYLRDQERVIAEIVEQGNSELMLLHHEIAIARQMLKDLKIDIRNAYQDKQLLAEDIAALQHHAVTLDPSFSQF